MDFDRSYADYLDAAAVKEIQQLEKETGKTLLAYYTPPIAAQLTPDQLARIQTLENKLCVRLEAYAIH
jgi:hypothetical protein